MPGFLTHYIAGKAALQSVSDDIQAIINADERIYNLGTQGPDIFFYYIPGQVRKRSRGVAQEMHGSGLGLFLVQMAQLAKQAGEERDTIFAYTAGFAMHYAVDCNAHPYVYAHTFKENALKIKNSADHRKLETAIDVALLKLVSGKTPAGISQWELVNASRDKRNVAAVAMCESIKAVYGREIPVGTARRAMKFMISGTRLLQSKNGRRKRFMQIFEHAVAGEVFVSCIVHMQELGDEDHLNLKKKPWHPPWLPEEEIFNDTFVDCYNAAVLEGTKMLEALYAFVYEDLPAEKLEEVLGNRSLKTGLPCAAPCGVESDKRCRPQDSELRPLRNGRYSA